MHKRSGWEAEKVVPVISADYCYMGHAKESELTSKCMPILMIKSHADRWIHSHAVPRKGCKHPWGRPSSQVGSKRLLSNQMGSQQ
eukprot:4990240-Amphidinium_carterae.2